MRKHSVSRNGRGKVLAEELGSVIYTFAVCHWGVMVSQCNVSCIGPGGDDERLSSMRALLNKEADSL